MFKIASSCDPICCYNILFILPNANISFIIHTKVICAHQKIFSDECQNDHMKNEENFITGNILKICINVHLNSWKCIEILFIDTRVNCSSGTMVHKWIHTLIDCTH